MPVRSRLPLAQLFQRFAAAAAQGAQFVQLGVVAFADDIAVGNAQGRLLVYGFIEQLATFPARPDIPRQNVL